MLSHVRPAPLPRAPSALAPLGLAPRVRRAACAQQPLCVCVCLSGLAPARMKNTVPTGARAHAAGGAGGIGAGARRL